MLLKTIMPYEKNYTHSHWLNAMLPVIFFSFWLGFNSRNQARHYFLQHKVDYKSQKARYSA